MFDVNFFAVVAVTHAFAPLLIKAKGTIMTTTSLAAVIPSMYNASKAAVQHVMDTLRIEMSPFDFKVIFVVTGVVKTKFLDNSPDITLPQNTIYEPVRAQIQHVANGVEFPDPMDPHLYARNVVADVTKKNPSSHVWRGGFTTRGWLITTFLWHDFGDSQLAEWAGLKKLAQILKGK